MDLVSHFRGFGLDLEDIGLTVTGLKSEAGERSTET